MTVNFNRTIEDDDILLQIPETFGLMFFRENYYLIRAVFFYRDGGVEKGLAP